MTQDEINYFLDPIGKSKVSLVDQPSDISYIMSRNWLNTSSKLILLYFIEHESTESHCKMSHRLVDISRGTGLSTVAIRSSLKNLIELNAVLNVGLSYCTPGLGSANGLRNYEIEMIKK